MVIHWYCGGKTYWRGVIDNCDPVQDKALACQSVPRLKEKSKEIDSNHSKVGAKGQEIRELMSMY